MIETKNLTYYYDEEPALSSVSITIKDGEFVVLTGPNGAGKSTLVRHFNGLLTPDSGRVLVDGDAVKENTFTARKAIGMVFQHPRDMLVAETVQKEVGFGPANLGLSIQTIDKRVKTALTAVDMWKHRDKSVTSLSSGEQTRIAIASVLAMQPSHLVLDEPFVGLDYPTRQRVLAYLQECHDEGMSLIIITHDLRDIGKLAEQIYVMKDGRIPLTGHLDTIQSELRSYGVRPP